MPCEMLINAGTIRYPSEVDPNTPFEVSFVVYNNGPDRCQAVAKILLNGEHEYMWSGFFIDPGEDKKCTYANCKISSDSNLELEAREYYTSNTDKEGPFLIRIKAPPPECSEGARETLEYCSDGSVKRERICENGKWREYAYTCPPPPPPPPECYEGARETLE